MDETRCILPGQSLSLAEDAAIKLGPGLVFDPLTSRIYATTSGVLSWSHSPASACIMSSSKRYVPATGDSVIGQITGKHAEGYRVDIGSHLPASLNGLAFFNVSRKNKPNLQVGGLVYARVSLGGKGMESELECLTGEGKAGGFGPLTSASSFVNGTDEGEATLIKDLDLSVCRSLLTEAGSLPLQLLGAKVSFEVVVGMNGRIYVRGEDVLSTMKVVDVVKGLDKCGGELEIRELVKQVCSR